MGGGQRVMDRDITIAANISIYIKYNIYTALSIAKRISISYGSYLDISIAYRDFRSPLASIIQARIIKTTSAPES